MRVPDNCKRTPGRADQDRVATNPALRHQALTCCTGTVRYPQMDSDIRNSHSMP